MSPSTVRDLEIFGHCLAGGHEGPRRSLSVKGTRVTRILSGDPVPDSQKIPVKNRVRTTLEAGYGVDYPTASDRKISSISGVF